MPAAPDRACGMSHLNLQSWLGVEIHTSLAHHLLGATLDEGYTGGLAQNLPRTYYTARHCTQPFHSPGDRRQPIPQISLLESPGCVNLEREKALRRGCV